MTASLAPLGLREEGKDSSLDKPFSGWDSPLCGLARGWQGRPATTNRDRPTENMHPKQAGIANLS